MLKIGVIGCGKIAQIRHIPEYAENRDCLLSAFYDPCKERSQEMAQKYGGKVCDSLEELLSMDLDAVSVCNINMAHAQTCILALKAGCHVLCEKPMAMNAEDCEKIIETQRESGKFLMVAQNQRFNKAHIMAKELISSGKIGKPITFHTTFGHAGTENWTGKKNTWFIHKDVSGYGAIADLGVHKIDLMQFILSSHFIEAFGVYDALEKKDEDGKPISVDDNAFCILKNEEGVIGQMHVSWTNYGSEDNSTRIYCTGGVIRCYDDRKDSLVIEYKDGRTERISPDVIITNDKQTKGERISTGVIDAFVNCIKNNQSPEIDAVEAYAALKVVFALEKSNSEKRMVRIEI